jgi:peptide/nickel transport system permease protein
VLTISPLATLCAYVVGCLMGLFAGYYRGWVDTALMQVCNVILSFPVLVLYVIIVMKFGPSPVNIVVAVTFVASPQVARLVRSQTLELREREYVAAAKMRGEPAWYIMLVEILPNARGPLIVDACLRMGYTRSPSGSRISRPGLLRPPDPDWGGMINASYGYVMGGQVLMALAPALASRWSSA